MDVILYLIGFFMIFIMFTNAKPELIEGDIILERKLNKIRSHSGEHRSKRSLFYKSKTHEHKWKDGSVPYVISTKLGKRARNAIEKAFREIEKYTCIRFTPWRQQKDFVEFVKDEGCYSNIGRQKGRQVISIGEGCETKITVIHECLHALGMFHEQTRLDRGLYVNILWWNVKSGAEKNFDTYDHGVIDSMKFPYDYHSATHYLKKDFTKNGKDTLRAIEKPSRQLGNNKGMSKIDIRKINKYYQCHKHKKRPAKAVCKDMWLGCSKYTRYCQIKWFAETYCQYACSVCIE